LRVLTIVHHRNAATGVFADALAAAGAELREWLPHEEEPPSLDGFDAAIVFGADAQVDQEDAHPWLRPEKRLIRELLERDTPALGVCFGSQLLAESAGGTVRPSVVPEVGWREVELTSDGRTDPLLGFLPTRFDGLHYHSYEWLLPPGAVALARSAICLQAFRLRDRPVWGVQFHPEVTESDFSEWLDDWDDDPDAIRAETATKIAAWNEVGRELVKRFLAAATAA
jgi:GMP synthase-like glutamine amidotransferase